LEHKELRVKLGQQAHKVPPDLLDQPEQQALLEIQVLKEQQVLLDRKVQQVQQEPKVQQVQQVLKEVLEKLEQQAHKEQLEQQAHKEQLVQPLI
jgi:hypothetical protein